jgi:type III pantothenate kinase
MLLVIDVGNTNTVIGVYDDKDQLKENWRIRTVRDNTADEFNILARALFADRGLPLTALSRVVISSVVPSSVGILDGFCRRYLGLTPLWIQPSCVKQRMPTATPMRWGRTASSMPWLLMTSTKPD